MICNYFTEPSYLIFVSDLPELFYYSHIPVAVAALLIGSFVYFNNPKSLPNRLLLAINLCFSLWIFVNIIAWTNIHSDILLFLWPFLAIFTCLISVLSVYFIYVFIHKKDAPSWFLFALLALIAPVIVLGPTDFNVGGFDITNCDAFIYEGNWYKNYFAFANIVAMSWILYLVTTGIYKATSRDRKRQILFMGLGIEAFLFVFFSIVFLAQYLTLSGLADDSRIEMYGLFGMAAFVGILGYLIVRYQVFNIKLIATQALVVGLILLVSSEFFFVQTTVSKFLVGVTLFGTIAGGFFLVRSVKREVEQKTLAQKLATELAGANMRLERLDKMKSEFVSIASHQLRSPLTSVRGYISMVMEGSYGEINPKVKEVLTHVADAARHMALSIEDYLNVSRIEAGNMKYEITDYDLKKLAEEVVVELLPVGEKKGIKIEFKPEVTDTAVVKLDIGKTRQIVMNLIDNALKYTQGNGAVMVSVRKDVSNKMAYIDVTDHGIGISAEGIQALFQKFERAKNANEINVTGTGLGLYIARTMARSMGGDITVTSPGEGKGSTFTLSMPLNGIDAKWGSK